MHPNRFTEITQMSTNNNSRNNDDGKSKKRPLTSPWNRAQRTGENTTEGNEIQYELRHTNDLQQQQQQQQQSPDQFHQTRYDDESASISTKPSMFLTEDETDFDDDSLPNIPIVEDVTSLIDENTTSRDLPTNENDDGIDPECVMMFEGVESPVFDEPDFSNDGESSEDAGIMEDMDLDSVTGSFPDTPVRRKSIGSLSEIIEKDAASQRRSFTSLPEWLSKEASVLYSPKRKRRNNKNTGSKTGNGGNGHRDNNRENDNNDYFHDDDDDLTIDKDDEHDR